MLHVLQAEDTAVARPPDAAEAEAFLNAAVSPAQASLVTGLRRVRERRTAGSTVRRGQSREAKSTEDELIRNI